MTADDLPFVGAGRLEAHVTDLIAVLADLEANRAGPMSARNLSSGRGGGAGAETGEPASVGPLLPTSNSPAATAKTLALRIALAFVRTP